jgi:hypothetical protein
LVFLLLYSENLFIGLGAGIGAAIILAIGLFCLIWVVKKYRVSRRRIMATTEAL